MSNRSLTSPTLVRRTFQHRQDDRETSALERDSKLRRTDWVLLGNSVAVRQLRSQIQRIAPHFRAALIRGERGVGKELAARAIHALSPSADGPFVMFHGTGHAGRPGQEVFESARGGTLYLWGIETLSPALQGELLGIMDEGQWRWPGSQHAGRDGTERRRAHIRILAASNRDLGALAAAGQFHQELYERLSAVEIFVPALRQRIEDIPSLAAWLLRDSEPATGQCPKHLAESTIAQLQKYPWANNLRELESVIARSAALAEGATIEPRHVLVRVDSENTPSTPPLDRLRDVVEKHMLEVLSRCNGNKLRAAELLGISRSTLYRMLGSTKLPCDL